MVKVFSKLASDAGHKVHLPFVGDIVFDDDCSFEVTDEDIAQQLVDAMPARLTLDKNVSEKTAGAAITTSEGRLAELKKMKMSELKEIAESFPKEEWEKLQKNPLAEYLNKKLGEAIETKAQTETGNGKTGEDDDDDDQ